jgi:calcineurin-like phosphoesterase
MLPVATGVVRMCGVLIEVDEVTGRATEIRRLQEDVVL